jgi:phosphohistidine swiveling domain-containing protein
MSFCIVLPRARAEDGPRIGGKARSLLRLAAAGLPVPPAIAVSSDLHRALRAGGPPLGTLADEPSLAVTADAATALAAASWPAGFEAELAAALAHLSPDPGARFSVRSSATLEDRADALGAGLFLSRTDVPAAEVPAAVRAVLAAALSPAALAYAARRGLPTGELAMAVLIHPFSRGDAMGTAALDPASREEPRVETSRGAPSPAARARIVEAARALAAREGSVELEWVATGDAVLFLQVRPYRAPVTRPWSHAAVLADGTSSPTWTWDAAHNPLPLSPAHAGLVALVDERCRTAFRQRVVGGYLFFAPAPTPMIGPASAPDALRAVTREADARLAALAPDAPLDDALGLFVEVYEPLYGVVQPAARAARDALAAYLRARDAPETLADLLRGVPSLATERARRAAAIASTSDPDERAAAVATYLARFGDEAPVWDVASPTFAEDPGALHDLVDRPISAPEAGPNAEPTLPADGRALLAAARAAAAVAEDDDVLYARVQSRVRRALLREGRHLQAANLLARAEDVFWLPLEAVRRGARGEEPLTLAAVTHAVAAAREAYAAALADPPPLVGARPAGEAREGGVRGRSASGGRAVGLVHVHDPGARAPVPAGAILIARTLLPAELPLLAPAAIVVETGGVLGHVAAQARERGLPAIVDATGAVAAFRAGDRVLVDGDAGVAIRLD